MAQSWGSLVLEGTPNKMFDEQAFLRLLEKGASLRQLESKGSFWGWASLLQTKTSPMSVYVHSSKGQSRGKESQIECIHTFFSSLQEG